MFNNSVVPRREYSLSSLERQNLKAVVRESEINTPCSLSWQVRQQHRSTNLALFMEFKLQRWYTTTFTIDTKDCISKNILGTEVNIVDVFNYEFPTKAPTSVLFQWSDAHCGCFPTLTLRTQLFKKLFAGFFNELARITSVISCRGYYRCCFWRRSVPDRSVSWSYILLLDGAQSTCVS
jgi:hypothetical protein